MAARHRIIAALVLLIILAGCTTSGGVEGEDTQSEGDAVSISGPECSPVSDPGASCSRISKYDNLKISLSVQNTGSRPVAIPFNDLEPTGTGGSILPEDITPEKEETAFNNIKASVLRSRCPQFFSMVQSSLTIEKVTTGGISTYEKPQNTDSIDVQDNFWDSEEETDLVLNDLFKNHDREVVLESGEQLDYEWLLRLKDPEKLKGGFSCPLSFRLNTEQEVSSLRRIQLKENEQIDSLPSSTRSTPGPMTLKIDAPDTWVVGELEQFPVEVYLENRGSGTPSERITFPAFGDHVFDEDLINCDLESEQEPGLKENEVRMLNNRQRTTKKKFSCGAGELENTESETAILTLDARYAYRYEIGTIDITLCEGDSC